MSGLTALETKTKAGAPCDVSNISKRGRALVKAGASRVVRPHKGPASQKPAKLKSAYRLRPGQVDKLEQQRCELKRRSTDAFKQYSTGGLIFQQRPPMCFWSENNQIRVTGINN